MSIVVKIFYAHTALGLSPTMTTFVASQSLLLAGGQMVYPSDSGLPTTRLTVDIPGSLETMVVASEICDLI